MKETLAGLILAAFTFIVSTSAQERPPEPDGYRMEDYRAPVPVTLAGVRVLTTAEAGAIWRAKAGVFIDVLPRAPKPKNLPEGTVWRDKPRLNIPGSMWLPDTGYGKLAAATEDYLRRGLVRATAGNSTALVVIYCQADCWMSWNAAKRILTYGYSNVACKVELAPACSTQAACVRGTGWSVVTAQPNLILLAPIRFPAGSFVQARTDAGRSPSAPRRRI